MAKGLGIKVELDYPQANEIKRELEGIFNKAKPELKIDIDKNSLGEVRKLISDITENEEIKIGIDTSDSVRQLQNITEELRNVKQMSEQAFELNGMVKAFSEAAQEAERFGDTNQQASQQSRDAAQQNVVSLRDMANVQKEIYNLQARSAGAGAQEQQVYNQRIQQLNNELEGMKQSYVEINGVEPDPEWIQQTVGEVGEFNVALRQAKSEQQELAEGQRQYTQLINEEYRIRKQLEGATGEHADALRQQLQYTKQQQQAVSEQYSLEQKLTDEQQAGLQSLRKQNELQLDVTRAKEQTAQATKEQQSAYRALRSDLNEIHKLEVQIADLQAKQDAGVQTAKEDQRLATLKQELEVRQQSHQIMRREAENQGLITTEIQESLTAIERSNQEKREGEQLISQQNAEIQQQEQRYREIYEIQSRIADLNRDLKNAGSREANAIQEQIRLEQRRVDAIMDGEDALRDTNRARDREIDRIQEAQQEQTELNAEIAKTGQMDSFASLEALNNISAREIFGELRQGFEMIHQEVGKLDAGLIDIEKVADASEAEMNRYKENMFEFASDVSTSADQYNVAVERWVTQGYDLAEGMELARHSLIGSFVGNIPEDEMVQYMSIPMNAFKDQGLEVQDILNSMNEVANNNAIEMDGLGEAYKNAAQTAGIAGTGFHELTGLISGAEEATRLGGARIGRGLRMMDMNFGQMAAGLTKSHQDRFDFFEGIGVAIQDSNGELRSTYDILEDLNGVWDSLSAEQQNTAAFYAAQKEHAPILQGIMNNWDGVSKATGEAAHQMNLFDKESGSAYQEFEIQSDSIQSATAKMTNSFLELLVAVSGGREGVIAVLDGITKALRFLIQAAENPALQWVAKFILGNALMIGGIKVAHTFFGVMNKGITLLINDGAKLISLFTGKSVGTIGSFFDIFKTGGSVAASSMDEVAEATTRVGRNSGGIKAAGLSMLKFGAITGGVIATIWGVNKAMGHFFDYDLTDFALDAWEELQASIKGVSVESIELNKIVKEQEQALKSFGETDFISGKTNNMISGLRELKEEFNLDGIEDAATENIEKYVVQTGDTLSSIAAQHDLSIDQLIELNPEIEVDNPIHVGEEIVVEGDATLNTNMTASLSQEDFKGLQSSIDSFVQENGLEEYDVELLINSTADIQYTFNELDAAVKDKATADIADSLNELEGVLEASDQALEYNTEVDYDLDTMKAQGLVDELGEITAKGNRILKEGANGFEDSALTTKIAGGRFLDWLETYSAESNGINESMIKASQRNTEEWKLQDQAFSNSIKAIDATQNELVDTLQMTDLDVPDIANMLGTEEAAGDIGRLIPIMAGVGTEVLTASGSFDTLVDMMKNVRDAGGEVDDEMAQIPHSVMRALTEAMPHLEGMPADLRHEAWQPMLEDIDGFVEESGGALEKFGENWKSTMAGLMAEEGMADEWYNFQEGMSDGIQGVIEMMEMLAQTGRYTNEELAQSMGISLEATQTFGDELFNVMSKHQEMVEQLDTEIVTKYNLMMDDGTVNMDVIESVHSLPEELTTKFELIGEDGIVNMENLHGMLKEIEDNPELMHWLATFEVIDENGNWSLDRLMDVFVNNKDNEYVQKFAAELGLDPTVFMEEAEAADYKIQKMAYDTANNPPALGLDVSGFNNSYQEMLVKMQTLSTHGVHIKSKLDTSGFDGGALTLQQKTMVLNQMGIDFQTGMDLSGFNDDELIVLHRLGMISMQEATPHIDADKSQFETKRILVLQALGLFDYEWAHANLGMNKTEFELAQADANVTLDQFAADTHTTTIDGNNTSAKNETNEAVNYIDSSSGTTTIDGNDSSARNTLTSLIAAVIGSKGDVSIGGEDTGARGVLSSLLTSIKNSNPIVRIGAEIVGSISGAINNFINGSVGIPTVLEGEEQSAKSMAINPVIGRSFSSSITDAVNTGVARSNTSFNTTDERPPSRVSSDVWRYWSKELYTGLPLDSSMSDLEREISKNNDNYEKLIPLYRQQIDLINKQIEHEQSMLNSQQSEMNHLLSQLRKEGFNTSGNRVTNLSRAKSLRGDDADEATELLNQWKSLYESMEGTRQSIQALANDRLNVNQDIDDTRENIELEKVEKELEKIEGRLKTTEGLLDGISNRTELMSTKMNLIDSEDFELNLALNEESINVASRNIRQLTDEFNRLINVNVKYSENAEEIESQLDSLASEILSNADAVLEYREAMNDIEIDRFDGDFSNFADAMDSNISRIEDNISTLQEGLISGTSLSDLGSTNLLGVDFGRSSEMEREHRQRLNLEAELNEALDLYAQKNIDRTRKVANQQMLIEQDKYSQLLQLHNDYTNGRVGNIVVGRPDIAIGRTSVGNSQNQREYTQWQEKLLGITQKYQREYEDMIDTYDNAMDKSNSAAEVEAINRNMVIEQLELQKQIYSEMIQINSEAMNHARQMLNDDSLNTAQRQSILDMISEYEEANIEAQEGIREAIESRYEIEFELLDKAIERSEQYTESISSIMEIAEAVGVTEDTLLSINKAMFQASFNEYGTLLSIIEELEARQSNLDIGSLEWNMIDEQLEDVRSGLADITLDILNTNQDILENQMESIQKANEEMLLGMSLDEYEHIADNWISGVEKEIELEGLMRNMASLEDQTLMKRLELMDRQEKVSQNELEYVSMLIEAQQLREKINNIEQERNVKTLGIDGSGNWQWQYVSDRSEIQDTRDELRELEVEIEDFLQEQRTGYVSDMNDILGQVADGDFSSMSDLQDAIAEVNGRYQSVLGEDMNRYDIQSILDAYQGYLMTNDDILNRTEMGTGGESSDFSYMSESFVKSFEHISGHLGHIIGQEIRRALNTAEVNRLGGQSMVIQNQTLEFPNVHDANGLEEAFRELPNMVAQFGTSK